MSIQQSYNRWAAQYDSDPNKTRDLEGVALRTLLAQIPFKTCLEMGCGTGKNTGWLLEKADQVTAVDLSDEMLARAKAKNPSDRVRFLQADLTKPWTFRQDRFDLVTFSLVLEHIEKLAPVFREAADALHPGGHVYVGELHPFRQYSGSKARFDTEDGVHVVDCFTHHLSDFVQTAKEVGLLPVEITEFFDHDDRTTVPRILALVLKKV